MTKSQRQKIIKIFPDFLDLLAMGLSAGFIFQQALLQAVEALGDNEVSAVFHQTLGGGDPLQGLQQLTHQLKEPRIQALVALMSQAASKGIPLERILAEQAEFLREERFLDLEKKAQTAGIRLLFPIMLFIFPTFFILLLGSLFLQIQQQGFFN